jgi:hypothetical protein
LVGLVVSHEVTWERSVRPSILRKPAIRLAARAE